MQPYPPSQGCTQEQNQHANGASCQQPAARELQARSVRGGQGFERRKPSKQHHGPINGSTRNIVETVPVRYRSNTQFLTLRSVKSPSDELLVSVLRCEAKSELRSIPHGQVFQTHRICIR